MDLPVFARIRRWRRGIFIVAPALAFAAGCGESRVAVFPVSGKVTFEGQPPAGALIVLHPVKPLEGGVAPTAAVQKDGSFQVTAYEKNDGAPPGDYVATIEWYKFDEKLGGSGPNVLPSVYSRAATSPIKITVKADGPTALDPIVIAAGKGQTARRMIQPSRSATLR